ncbi:cysteine proteinase inhibitor 4-like [Dendrobium catenatum]|uniref:Cysteine proteinase inhibitor 5 n=1 Tax=Dendrobium catenatum TaxID=906689 RepID=A0A2I0WCA4_9ASPA|nr:cysteine proteinase inhibitor 4-like [Dendrobium catenatum]PKU73282.1 Cysteine proteinase inhibitor 5 [Dendrobium catenatum]
MKNLIFLSSLVLAASLFVTAASGSGGSGRRGLSDVGWEPIKNLSDPHVLEIAKFAVNENNKNSHTNLTLYKVESGETTISVGALYRLIIVVGVGNVYGVLAEYEATVLEKSSGNFELLSFKWIRP